MNKKLISFSLILIAVITIPSLGNVYWTGLGGDSFWSNGNNWDVYEPPYTSDLAVIDLADSNCLIDETVNTSVAGVWVGFSQRPCYLDITGGNLTATTAGLGLRMGIDNGTGIVRMSGGNVTVNGDMAVGQGANGEGTLEMTDGTLTVSGSAWLYVGYGGSIGKIELQGGTISTFYLSMDADGTQNVNITGDGQLIIRDPRPSEIEYQILSFYAAPERNWITAYDGTGTLDLAVGPNNETIITAVPPVCWPVPRADLTGDCIVNFEDLAVMAEEWLICNKTDGSCPSEE